MNLNTDLPSGISRYLTKKKWEIVDSVLIYGGYAATLFLVSVKLPDGTTLKLVYKQLTSEREDEVFLYRQVLKDYPNLIPYVYAYIEQGEEHGLLMEFCGDTLKGILQEKSESQVIAHLKQAVIWLAEIHIQFESMIPSLVSRGLKDRYPVASSESWARFAISMMGKLQESDQSKRSDQMLSKEDIHLVQSMTDWLYPRYENWHDGRVTLTHGDPHLENFLFSDSGYRLIDWEATCAAVPHRDLAVFLQDVLDATHHQTVKYTYLAHMKSRGWEVESQQFNDSLQAVFFDNTLMMMGWEIHKFLKGYLTSTEIKKIIEIKLKWLKDSFIQLR